MRRVDIYLSIYLPALFCYTSRYITNSTLPLYLIRDLHLSKSLTGLIISSVALGRFLADIPSGVLMDRFGSKFLIITFLLMSISSLICALSTAFLGLLCAGLFFEGLGMAASVVAWQTLAAHRVPEGQRANVSATIGGLNRLGAVIAPLFGGFIYEFFGIKYVFVIQALFPLICVFLALYSRSLAQTDLLLIPRNEASSITTLLRENIYSILFVLPFITGLQITRETRKLGIPVLANNFDWSAQLITGLLSFSYAFDVLLAPLAAWLYRRWGVRCAAVVGISLFSVGLGILALGSTHPAALWAGAAVAGVANGASSGIVVALGVAISPEISSSAFSGIFRAICDLGEILGPIVCGALLDRFTVFVAFLCVAGVAWAGLLVFLLAPEKKPVPIASTPAPDKVGCDLPALAAGA